MKATINSYIKGKVNLIVSDVEKEGVFSIVKKNGENSYVELSGVMSINDSMSVEMLWPVEEIVRDGFKLLYKYDNCQELIDINIDKFLSSLQPFQASIFKELPSAINRIAACTICYNEDFIIKKWAEYYGSILGYENLYVIDDGSDTPVAEVLKGLPVNITRIPRTAFDTWRLVRSVGLMQRLLLETYDLVITSDSDEFIFCNSEEFGYDLRRYFVSKRPEALVNLAPIGFDLVHSRSKEPDLDFTRPILEQRKYVRRSIGFDKPAISTVPTSFLPGLHNSYFPKVVDANLMLLHVRVFDYNFALSKLTRYQKTAWSEHDLASGLSSHQRIKVEEMDKDFLEFEERIGRIVENKSMTDLSELEAAIMPDEMRRRVAL